MFTDDTKIYPKLFNGIVTAIVLLVPHVYILYVILAQLLPNAQKCFTRGKAFLLKSKKKLQVQLEDEFEDKTLLTNGVVNYNTCH